MRTIDNQLTLRTEFPTFPHNSDSEKSGRLLCNKPQEVVTVNTENQMKQLLSSDHSLFFVKSSTDVQLKDEFKPPLKLNHDFSSVAYKKGN